jgi:hypothetical protein
MPLVAMRTTLALDDDVLQAAKELAEARGTTAGKVLSELARRGLQRPATEKIRNGVPLMPPQKAGTPKMTLAIVNELLDEP